MVLIRPATRPMRIKYHISHISGKDKATVRTNAHVIFLGAFSSSLLRSFSFELFSILSFTGLGRQLFLPLAILSRISSRSFPRGIRDKSKRHSHMFPRRHLSTGPPLPGFRRCGGFRNYSVATFQSSRDAHSDASLTKGTGLTTIYQANQAELSWPHGYVSTISQSYF